MNITEPSGLLARWKLRISELVFDTRAFDTRDLKRIKYSLADCMSGTPTTVHTNVEVGQDIPSFLVELVGFDDNFESNEPVPVDTRVVNSIF